MAVVEEAADRRGVGLGVLQVCLYTYVAGIVGERKELLNAVSDADAINYQSAP